MSCVWILILVLAVCDVIGSADQSEDSRRDQMTETEDGQIYNLPGQIQQLRTLLAPNDHLLVEPFQVMFPPDDIQDNIQSDEQDPHNANSLDYSEQYIDSLKQDKRMQASSFFGSRGKKDEESTDDFEDDNYVEHNDNTDVDKKMAPSGFFGARGKKMAPSAFYGSRGKKMAPSGFFGARGKKMAPSGFFGARGKKMGADTFFGSRGKKMAPSGFFGARGKKMAPSGFYGSRGKKMAPSAFFGARGKKMGLDSAFFGARGKKMGSSSAFVGARGKKWDIQRVLVPRINSEQVNH